MHKPSNWWAYEREPWLRVGKLADAAEKRREADAALAMAYAETGRTFRGFAARRAGAPAVTADAVCAGLAFIGAVLPDAPCVDEDE